MTGPVGRGARVLALVAAVLAQSCGAGAPPRLELTGGLVDDRARDSATAAGTVGEARATVADGGLVAARYDLRNVGGRPLVLHGLALDCGCRLAAPLPDALAPGERTSLRVRCRAPLGSGEAVREQRLFSNDPLEPELALRVAITVAGSEADPAELYFGYVPVGGTATRRLVLPAPGARREPSRGRDAAAHDPAQPPVAGDPAITVEPGPPDAGGRRVYLARFAPRAPGPFRATLDLGLEGGIVPVRGVGFRGVLVVPAEVTLPHPATAGGAPAIVLTNLRDDPLAVTRVELPAGLTGELQATTPGQVFRLSLRERGRPSDGPIRIHTSAPDEPLVVVPVVRGEPS